MKYLTRFSFTASLVALAACSQVPTEAYFNRGTPESLLDLSSEAVNVPLSDPSGLEELKDWVNREQPSRAVLDCRAGEPACNHAREVLDQFGVTYETVERGGDTVSLYYERVLARDCENRYIDNSINPYNLNHPTFGCSVAANIVQHVSDKRQFVNPGLLDFYDGQKAAQNYRGYLKNDDSFSKSSGKSALSSQTGSK